MSKIASIPDAASISVDYVTSCQYDYLCIFSVKLQGTCTIYALDVTSPVFKKLNKKTLPKYLLENIRRASVVRSFSCETQ
jgi:hypothetical protein